jgi:glutathione peroxidase
MFKVILISAAFLTGSIASIYSYRVSSISYGEIKFNDYQHKKILIVNTATGSNLASQLTQLEQLYLQHQDSVVVIAFPSNSFGNEPGTNADIKNTMEGTYGITFPIAIKSPVIGDTANVIYQWLRSKLMNGVMNGKTKGDFQKYLIDMDGKIVAEFDGTISPTSTALLNALHNDF